MQIRTGDRNIGRANVSGPLRHTYRPYFECATRSFAPSAFYLMSDSSALRARAREEYGERLVTHTDPAHSPIASADASKPGRHPQTAGSLLGVAGELWTASRACDSFVVSVHGGLGRQAFLLSAAVNASGDRLRVMPGCRKMALRELMSTHSKI